MDRVPFFNRLFVRITAAFLLAAIVGVVLVAVWAYNATSGSFSEFVRHAEEMEGMMGGMMRGMMGSPGLVRAQEDFVANLGRTLWLAGLAGAALAIILGYLLTRHIVSPLGKVTDAARKVTAGDLQQRVQVQGAGELAELGDSFNRMATALNRDRELRQNMVADIAHELRTPLAILQGNIEAMQDGVKQADADNLASIHQETLLLARLVDDLRTLSLAEGGQLKFQPEPVDMKGLLTRVVENYRAQAEARKVELALEAPDSPPAAWADPERTAQVVRNLLNNAFQYTTEGGRITVTLAEEGGGPAISVEDTGAGISAEDLPNVFDRFYRVDRSRTRSTGGTGLGLAIVRQLVEAQGGSVRAESLPGGGSTFSFTLPKAE